MPNSRQKLQSGITLDRDLFEYDARRAIRIGWALLTITMISSIINLDGGIEKWKVQAIAAAAISLIFSFILEIATKSGLSYIPNAMVIAYLPIHFAYNSSQSWIAYGFIVITAIMYSAFLQNRIVSIAIMYGLIILQYAVAQRNFPSISDNIDNRLLGSYFSTLWCAAVGIGALILKDSYIKYSTEIESVIAKIHKFHSEQREKSSHLNLRDHENSQLHGTVLNTLIAIRNSPALLKNNQEIAKFIDIDLAKLKSQKNGNLKNFETFITDPQNFPFQREVAISCEVPPFIELDSEIEEVALEIARELILNTKKHSSATECKIIVREDFITEERTSDDEFERCLKIEITDNSPSISSGRDLVSEALQSRSIERLIKNVHGEQIVTIVDGLLLRKIIIPLPMNHSSYLNRIVQLREQSIRYLAIGYIRISLIYAVLTFPAYIRLGITKELAGLILLYIGFTVYALYARRWARHFAQAGAFFAIATFPMITFQELSCSKLQFVPWLFNGLLGPVFFATLLFRNPIIKWTPIVLFYAVNLQLSKSLPTECALLLNGSTPAIISIALIAVALGFARRRDLTFEARFISEAQSEIAGIAKVGERVAHARLFLISVLEDFSSKLKSNVSLDSSREISSIVTLIRTFLITSEYFESELAFNLNRFAQMRFERGFKTTVNLLVPIIKNEPPAQKVEEALDGIAKISEGKDLIINVTDGDSCSVQVTAEDGSELRPFEFKYGKFVLKTV